MLETLQIKRRIENANAGDFKMTQKPEAFTPFKSSIGDYADDDIEMQISELNALDRYLDKSNKKINQPSPFPQWQQPKRSTNLTTKIKPTDTIDALRNMGAFDPYRGGVRKKRRGRTRRVCKVRRRTIQ